MGSRVLPVELCCVVRVGLVLPVRWGWVARGSVSQWVPGL